MITDAAAAGLRIGAQVDFEFPRPRAAAADMAAHDFAFRVPANAMLADLRASSGVLLERIASTPGVSAAGHCVGTATVLASILMRSVMFPRLARTGFAQSPS